jgi:hypothetical protein
MSWWSSVWQDRAKAWIFSRIGNVEGGQPSELKPGEHYLSISVDTTWITDVRKAWNRYYGVVHGHVVIPHPRGQNETVLVASPSSLKNVDPKHLDRVILGKTPLVRKQPYLGGVVQLEVGLISVKGDDLAVPFLNLIESLSKAPAAAPLALLKPVKVGIDSLMGLGSEVATLEIGTSRALDPPQPGRYLLIRATREELDLPTIRFNADENRLVDGSGATVDRYPYMIVSVEAFMEKDDFYSLPEINTIYNDLFRAAQDGDDRKVSELVRAFTRAARYSLDLLPKDGERLAGLIGERFEHNGRGGPLESIQQPPPLKDIGLYT